MDGLLVVIIIIAVIVFFIWIISRESKEDKAIRKHQEELLKDEYIYNPETGEKLTLEQAESGIWTQDDIIIDTDSEKYYYGQDRQIEELLNYFKRATDYNFIEQISEERLEKLEKTSILSKYESWSYSDFHSFNNGQSFVFLPIIEIRAKTRHEHHFSEPQIMFWLKIKNSSGHYYLREKTSTEKLIGKILDDNDLKFEHYESFTIEKSINTYPINKVLLLFVNEKGLEIEVNKDDLFIKTTQSCNLEDFLRLEKAIAKIGNMSMF